MNLRVAACFSVCCGLLVSCRQSSPPGEAFVAAAYAGNVQKVKAMVSGGVDVNYRAKALRGDTALTAAVRQRNTEVVRYLLSAGADPNLPDSQQFSPLYIALASPGDASLVVKALIEAGALTEPVKAIAQEMRGTDPNKKAFDEATRQLEGP